MTILIATGIYPPDIGGPATYATFVADNLRKRGVDVLVLTYGDSHSKGITSVSRRVPKGFRHVLYFLKALFLMRKVDIVFALDPVSAGFPALLAAQITRRAYIVRIAGDYAWEQGVVRFGVSDLLDTFLTKSYGLRVGLLRFIQKYVASHARTIIVPSEYLKNVVRRWNVSTEVCVVENAVLMPPHIDREHARDRLEFSGTILLSVGRMVPWKGFLALIEAVPKLLSKIPNLTLVLLGDGPEYEKLKKVSSTLCVEKNVRMPGAVSRDAMWMYLSASDIFLLNTAYEGFSHQILEAMAAGTPVVTTDAGGNKEIVQDKKNALVVTYNHQGEWQDALTELLANNTLREKLIGGGAKTVEHFSPERMIDKLASVLSNI